MTFSKGVVLWPLRRENNRDDAIDRREHERVTDNRSDPVPIWFAWRWNCR